MKERSLSDFFSLPSNIVLVNKICCYWLVIQPYLEKQELHMDFW
jgi:hypothetical protein